MIQRFLPKFLSELDDPRYFQILYLGSFLVYGIGYLNWEVNAQYYVAVLLTAVATQLSFAHFTNQSYSSVKSALISALGLCILLHVSAVWVGVLAAFVAIASKFIIRIKSKHIFNPANIGIIAAIALTGQAWVSPGQWGSDAIMWFFIGAAGLMMILKVGRLDTAFTFLIVFGLALYCYQVGYLGWEPQVWMHKMNNGTLLLFAFFMITDPRTTPNHKTARIIWAALLALILFVVANYFYVQTAAIWLLFLISPFTVLLDKHFKSNPFAWKKINV